MSKAQELLDAATPLPWHVDDVLQYAVVKGVGGQSVTPLIAPGDAALIVCAANGLPGHEATAEALERLISVGDALWEDHPPAWLSAADEARAALRRLRDEVPA